MAVVRKCKESIAAVPAHGKRIRGHGVCMAGIILVALSRAFAYSPVVDYEAVWVQPVDKSEAGVWMYVFAGLWLLTALLAVVDWVRGYTAWSTPAFVSMLGLWGFSYFLAWAADGFGGMVWLTVFLYAGFAVFAYGAYKKVISLVGRLHAISGVVSAQQTGAIDLVAVEREDT